MFFHQYYKIITKMSLWIDCDMKVACLLAEEMYNSIIITIQLNRLFCLCACRREGESSQWLCWYQGECGTNSPAEITCFIDQF